MLATINREPGTTQLRKVLNRWKRSEICNLVFVGILKWQLLPQLVARCLFSESMRNDKGLEFKLDIA
jgi:hypothetical protein